MKRPSSEQLFSTACRVMPGGVSSPVRAFGKVGGTPPFIARAKGSHLWDADGNDYLDYVGSWGLAILGHAHPKVVAALAEAIELGTSFGAPTELEVRLAGMIADAVPSVEIVRFVNSGTEAAMSALRLARAATGHPLIVVFEGCYHGHADALLVKAGSGAATCGCPASAGVTEATAAETICLPYNDPEALERAFHKQGASIAAAIVEPIAGNMGCVLPRPEFLKALREITARHGALLIFDEVMTGFRVAFGGAQELFRIRPDLTIFGKIIGGGLPVGAYGGPRELMKLVAPLGPVYQAGTLSGNPLAMTAGFKTLEILSVPGAYDALEGTSAALCDGIGRALERCGLEHRIGRAGSMWSLFFTGCDVADFAGANGTDAGRFRRLFHFLLDRGIYLPPSPYESAFVSLAHTGEEILRTLEAVEGWARQEAG